MAPGGNDVLVLHSIPHLSAHAVPAYLAMTGGIALVLIAVRAARGRSLEVDCRHDVCVTQWISTIRPPHPTPLRREPADGWSTRSAESVQSGG